MVGLYGSRAGTGDQFVQGTALQGERGAADLVQDRLTRPVRGPHLPAERHDDHGCRAGSLEGMGHGLRSGTGDPQVFQEQDSGGISCGRDRRHREAVAVELPCVPVPGIGHGVDGAEPVMDGPDDLL